MEVDNAKLQRDIQLLNQSMIQQEREAQVALKTEQQAHEEDIEKGAREKVLLYIALWLQWILYNATSQGADLVMQN